MVTIGGSGNTHSIFNPVDEWQYGEQVGFKCVELSTSSGRRINQWLLLSVGFSGWFFSFSNPVPLQLIDENTSPSPEIAREYNDRLNYSYAIQESYLPSLLNGQLSAEVNFSKNVFADLFWDVSLTSASRSLKYKGESYTFQQKISHIAISLGYRFYKNPKNQTHWYDGFYKKARMK